MGAHFRFYERRIERQFAKSATKGVSAPPPPCWGVPQDGKGAIADRRSALPPLGLREYWYPLCPDRRVPRRKPLFWKMLGDELALFRGDDGEVKVITDVCPHRGASMAQGKCFYKGTIACPYHGAVFNGDGDCVAFITEGPDSKMVGNLPAKAYPTVTLKGWVFVWMGAGEPASMQEDIPPEFFEDRTRYIQWTYTYWQTSWIVALENQNDAHNAGLYVHRNSLTQLMSGRSRARTPIGPRSKLVNDAQLKPLGENQSYYADANGKIPFQMTYPGVGKWPKTKARKFIALPFKPWRWLLQNPIRRHWLGVVASNHPDEWKGGWHMPGMVRLNFPTGYGLYTRVAVPVEADVSRLVYFHTRLVRNPFSRVWVFIWHHLYYNWFVHYNFSGQDNRAASPCRYWTPENLSASDSHLILLRRLITERTRDAKLGKLAKVAGTTDAEEMSFKLQGELGRTVEDSLDKADDPTLLARSAPRRN